MFCSRAWHTLASIHPPQFLYTTQICTWKYFIPLRCKATAVGSLRLITAHCALTFVTKRIIDIPSLLIRLMAEWNVADSLLAATLLTVVSSLSLRLLPGLLLTKGLLASGTQWLLFGWLSPNRTIGLFTGRPLLGSLSRSGASAYACASSSRLEAIGSNALMVSIPTCICSKGNIAGLILPGKLVNSCTNTHA